MDLKDIKFELTPFGQIVWEDRYALKDENGNKIEDNILENFKRVAKAIASKEKDPKKWEKKFYEIMAYKYFSPAGRILAHAGTHYSQLLNCFVLPFKDDSLESIMDTAKNMAITQKYGGGTGFNYSTLRPSGSHIKGVNGRSCGVPGFINMMSTVSEVIEQGGCFVGSTLVATSKGPVKIKDLHKGDLLWTLGNEGYELLPCSDPWITVRNAEVWKVETDKGLIVYATKTHPFMPAEGFDPLLKNYIRVEDLKSNISLMTFDNRSFENGHISSENSHKTSTVILSHNEDVYNVEVCGTHNYVVCTNDMLGVVVSNSRRGANLGLLEISHPDVWEFISYKTEHNWDHLREFIDVRDEEKWSQFKFENNYKLQMYNVSIGVTDEFFDALKKDDVWPLVWKGRDWDLYTVQFRKMRQGTYTDTNFEVTADSDKTALWKVKKKIPFPTAQDSFEVISKRKIKASELWEKICYNAWADGCPGLINLSTARRYHNLEYAHPLTSTNPCLTGETLVAVADGRNAVSIKKLAEEGKDVPVYCRGDKGKVTIRMMRNPRITGYNQKILKVTIEGGHCLRVNECHKIVLSDGSTVEAKDLRVGAGLSIMNKLQAPFEAIVRNSNSESQDYLWINSTDKKAWVLDHRLIYNFYNRQENLGFKKVIHHIDRNGLNNVISNLESLSKEDHDKKHSIDKLGDLNPMRRAQTEWSEEKWQSYHDNMSASVAGELNGRFSGISNEEIFDKAVELSNKYGRKLTKDEWEEHAKLIGYPAQFSEYRTKFLGAVPELLDRAANIAGVEGQGLNGIKFREYKRFLKIKEESDLDVFFDGSVIKVNKICEGCHEKFIVDYMQREQSFCTHSCSARNRVLTSAGRDRISQSKEVLREKKRIQQINAFNDLKLKLGRIPMKKEYAPYCKKLGIPFRLPVKREVAKGILVGTFHNWKELEETALQYNHRVISVEYDGIETVYNGTVDEFHNLYTGHFEEEFNGHKKFVYINSKQCGEQPISDYSSCNLSSILLSSFVKPDKTIDYDALKTTVQIAVRFADDVIDNCEFPIPEIKRMANLERRVGVGVLGAHDMLIELGQGYDTDEGRATIEKVLIFMRDTAYLTSIELAKEKGPFPAFDKEKIFNSHFIKTLPKEIQDQIEKHGLRNATLLSIAPTGTIGALFNSSTGCEPWFSLAFQRNTRLGSYEDGCPAYIKWKSAHFGEPKPSYFKTAQEISPEDHIKMMVLFSKYVDSAVSKTVNLPNSATVEDIKKAFIFAMENGAKGITVFRDGSKEGVFINKDVKKEAIAESKHIIQDLQHVKEEENDTRVAPKKRGDRVVGATTRIHMQKHNLYVTVNRNKEGEIIEVFATVGESKEPDAHHTSGVEDSWAESLGKMISLALRAGVKPDSIVRNLKNIPSDKPVFHTIGDCEASEPIPSPPHAIARVIEEELKYSCPVQHKIDESLKKGGPCPECGSVNTVRKATCSVCNDCGYSGCGS